MLQMASRENMKEKINQLYPMLSLIESMVTAPIFFWTVSTLDQQLPIGMTEKSEESLKRKEVF